MADHYVSMEMIRNNKMRKNNLQAVPVEDVYADPDSVVSNASSDEENVSVVEDTPSCSSTSVSGHSNNSASGENPYELFMPTTRKVVLNPGPSGLGISIAGGVKSPMGLLPVFITDIDPGGLVDQSRVVKVGDRIVGVNGENLEGKTHRDVVLAIKAARGQLILEVTEGQENIMKFISLDHE